MRPVELMSSVREAMSLVRVFGEPCERDGVTVLPVAAVRGGAGGGTGKKDQSADVGDGGGFGLMARPVGAYVLTEGKVEWQPAVDVNRIVTVAVLGWVTIAWLVTRAVRRR